MGRFFCRECVTDFAGKAVCASCLSQLAAGQSARGRFMVWLARAACSALALVVAWLFFYRLGRWLLSLPSEFHEGTHLGAVVRAIE